MRYGDLWRIHRRLFHRFFNVSAANQFDDKIHTAVNVFLRRLSGSPECFLKHAHLCVGSRPIFASSRAHHMLFGWKALLAL